MGVGLDDETRCSHYRSPVDIVALKAGCCGEYYACHACHAALADHELVPWPRDHRTAKARSVRRLRHRAHGERVPGAAADRCPRV